MDSHYLLMAARYVELNPVRAHLVPSPEKYKWSSVAAHINGQDDGFVKVAPILERVADWGAFLNAKTSAEEARSLQQHERTGRPLGNKHFIDDLEKILNRIVRPQ